MNSNESKPTSILIFIVRLLGLVVLIVGLTIGIKVILEAWNLYEEPVRIERFAIAIESGSHLDALVSSITNKASVEKAPSTGPRQLDAPVSKTTNNEQIRLSYFLAWAIAILLLMVIGSLASSAIRTGGQLALYDLQVKYFAKQLLNEARKKDHKQ